ncbi:SRPBCC domain-containing protein [bacterium]|nr:SRPBCC domain-containing protein [bacterium]MCI0607078.1 SRPBCC domain-containing protein [bacterium]
MTTGLTHNLERKILICAKRSTVFRYFTDSKRFADWWGEGSTIEGRPGGSMKIRFPNGIQASGKILEIEPPERIVFSYGFDSGKPIPPEGSLVTITLQELSDGTQVTLRHELSDAAVRDEFIQGWRYQLALFANVASCDQHSDIQNKVDAYFELWNSKDPEARRQKMETLLEGNMSFQDKYSCTSGLEDLNGHLSAIHHFMPGLTIVRDGDVHECQGAVLAHWKVLKTDGTEMSKGTNIFLLSPAGRIRWVTGFWG